LLDLWLAIRSAWVSSTSPPSNSSATPAVLIDKSGVTAGETALFSMINIDPELVGQLEQELRTGWNKNRVDAAIQAKKTHEINVQRHRAVEGLGALKARIPPTAYHFWGQKLGYGCWNDKTFMKEFIRDNPECRVNSGGTKEIHVGYTPGVVRSRTVYQ
jgi:hypothetical protein